MTTPQPPQPITIEVSNDGRALVRIGVQPHFIQQPSVDEARRAALRYVFDMLTPSTPIPLTAQEQGATTHLVMQPDGSVHVDQPPSSQPGPPNIPAPDARTRQPTAHTGSPPSAAAPGVLPPAPQPLEPAPVYGPAINNGATTPPTPNQHFVPQPPVAAPAGAFLTDTATTGPDQPDSPPSLQDLRARLTAAPEAPATWGWRGRLARWGMRVSPGREELKHRRAATAVQRSLRGPKTLVVVNVKGGENKTGTCFLLGAAIGRTRGGFTLAWDNNETRGTLAWKGVPATHHQATAVDFLHDLDRFSSVERSRVGDLDNYVRSQGDDQFDILASDEDASSMEAIDDQAFKAMHATLERFYRVIIVDTGNNVKASNYRAALDVADQLVVATTAGGDGVSAATWTMEHLQQTGHAELVRNAVTVLSVRDKDVAPADMSTYVDHLRKWTRSVVQIPHDEAMPRTTGAPINYDALSPASREAWLQAAAAVIGGLD